MPFFNKRKDFSKKPPVTPILPGLAVIDTSTIDLTYVANLGQLRADLVSVLSTPGTYGSSTMIPVFTVNQYGQIVSITQVPASGGGGGTYTVNNGLTENPSNNFQLGGVLLQNTTIDGGSNFLMDFTSSRPSPFPTVLIRNTGTGYGAWINSNNVTARLLTLNPSTSTVETNLELVRGVSSGIPSAGFGQSISFRSLSNSGSTLYLANRIISELSNTSPLNFTSVLKLTGVFNNIEKNLFELYGLGNARLNSYGAGIFTGTPAFALAVDASGNIIEYTPSSGGLTSVGLILDPPPSSPAIQINNSPLTSNGNLEIQFLGNANQLIDGQGNLRSIDSISVVSKVYQRNTFIAGANNTSVEYVSSVNKIYVANNSANTVSIFDATTGQLLSSIPAIIAPYKIKYISTSNEVWVTSSTTSNISRINVTTNAFIANITGATVFGHSFVEFSSTKVFISNWRASGSIMVVNPTTNAIDATITTSVPTFPGGMVLNNNPSSLQNGRIIIAAGGGVAILDPVTNAITTTVANPGSAISTGRNIVYNSTLDRYYIASIANNSLVVLNIATATTFTLNTRLENQFFNGEVQQDSVNDLLFTFPMEGGSTESVLVKIFKLSTLEPIIAFKTSCFGGASNEAGWAHVDNLNKRITLVGRNSIGNGCVSLIQYL